MGKFKALAHSCVYEYRDEISDNNYMIVIGRLGKPTVWWGEAFKNGNSVSCYSDVSFEYVFETLVNTVLEA